MTGVSKRIGQILDHARQGAWVWKWERPQEEKKQQELQKSDSWSRAIWA